MWCVSPAVQLFFAKVLRTATEEDVRQLFSQFGPVCEVNMFRAFQVGVAAGLWGQRGSAGSFVVLFTA
jgi:RNA recognition motif-containing protein